MRGRDTHAGRSTLSAGPAGFRELSHAIDGISDSTLSDRLSDLSKAGLITALSTKGCRSPFRTP